MFCRQLLTPLLLSTVSCKYNFWKPNSVETSWKGFHLFWLTGSIYSGLYALPHCVHYELKNACQLTLPWHSCKGLTFYKAYHIVIAPTTSVLNNVIVIHRNSPESDDLPPLSVFFGRDELTRETVWPLLSRSSVALIEPVGMGKTTVAYAVKNNDAIASMFGSRRYFLRFDEGHIANNICHMPYISIELLNP